MYCIQPEKYSFYWINEDFRIVRYFCSPVCRYVLHTLFSVTKYSIYRNKAFREDFARAVTKSACT